MVSRLLGWLIVCFVILSVYLLFGFFIEWTFAFGLSVGRWFD
jgi:hypothetical protein